MKGLDPAIEAIFGSQLTSSERVLWTGQPDPRRIFMKADWFPLSVSAVSFGCGLILFLATITNIQKVISNPGSVILIAVVTVLFLAISLFTGVFRYWLKRWIKRRTYYAITNRRTLFLKRRPGKSFVAGPLEGFPIMRREARVDGSGHLLFGAPNARFNKFGNTGMDFGGIFFPNGIAFYDIPDVVEVFRLAERARQQRFEFLAARG